MSYFSSMPALRSEGIEFELPAGLNLPMGCSEPTHAYGEQPGLMTFEAAAAAGLVENIPREEWPERIELLERSRATLMHRIDADWLQALYQGRCGYCWCYAVAGCMQSCDARDGRTHVQLAAASVAAQVKRGRDSGGWPPEAASWIAEHGICELDLWGDCTCGGRYCKGPRGGCPARDLSKVEETQENAKLHRIGEYFEIPRGDFDAVASCVLQGIPVAGGWVGMPTLWCNRHAMQITRLIRTSRGGYQLVPDNSWREFKRRLVVPTAPTGGVAVVRNRYRLFDSQEQRIAA